ncbi:MAG TPA: glycosyltransferase family 2 protein [Candidatus Binataceae bacterium]|nr:glycosyltransferase family 2 protein [Candidatus Binataceae bacterium]
MAAGVTMAESGGISASMVPSLSVVIIGRNEGERLERCIQSLTPVRESLLATEIIYVDSASTDNSRELAARLGARVISVTPPRPRAAIGRNAGWQASSAPIVLFLDGDTVLAPDFVEAALPQFADPEVAVVFGNRREMAAHQSIYNRVLDLDWIVPPGLVEYCGGDALMRREVLSGLNGYDEGLIAGEEPELCWRIRARGYRIVHLDRPMVGHDLAITRFGQYWRRAVRTGYAYAEVSARFRGTASPLWERPARRNLIHAPAMMGLTIGMVLLALVTGSIAPILAGAVIIMLLVLRTAAHVRGRVPELATRLLYGIHSHLGQVPIFVGQLKYRLDRWLGRGSELIEYKTAAEGRR